MKVTIILITYNHAAFIRQALDSLLMQETSFDYEILISEDFSTDGTRQIVLDYQQKHPDKIRLLLSHQNLNSNVVITRAFEAAQGQYIAMLDGDDYWLSPHKLQKQVDFLDQHPECALCFHNALVIYEDGSAENRLYIQKQREISTLKELLTSSFPTCSTMYRNGLISTFPEWFDALGMSDGPLHILHAQHGKIGYIDEVMGAYRIHRGGLWSSLSKIRKQHEYIKLYETINHHTNYEYRSILQGLISKCYYRLAVEHARNSELDVAKSYAISSIREKPLNTHLSITEIARLLMLLSSSRAYQSLDRMLLKRRSPMPRH